MFKYLKLVDSTNSYCKQNLDDLSDKTVVYTYHQTGGRGRFERKWLELGADNLYLSLILKPSTTFKPVYTNLTQYTSLKLAELFSNTYNIKPYIKWPNDVLVNGKKISGILAETVYSGGNLNGIIIGVGINLNTRAETLHKINQPATALNLELGYEVDKQKFLEEFYQTFFDSYDEFLSLGFKSIKNSYEAYCTFLNKNITIHVSSDLDVKGKAEKISDDGALIINGNSYYTGDVTESY